MTRQLAIALVCACLVAGAGYVVYSKTLGAPHDVPAEVPAPVPPAPAPAPAPAAKAPVAQPRLTKVTAISGRVEKQTQSGWSALRVGDELTAHDTIRTAEGGRATLDTGVIVEVDDRTELGVGEITESISELALNEGRITANAGSGGPTVRISTRNSDAVAEADAGSFDVLSSGGGDMTVAAREGNVRLSARRTSVTVGAGQLSTAAAGMTPTAPAKIPPSLFLKVAAKHKAGVSDVTGEAPPGSVVSLGERVTVVAGEDGQFAAEVPVSKGETKIVVQVEDVLGRRERKVIPRKIVKTKLDTKVEWQ